MTQLQLFKKQSDGIQSRKSQFLSGLELCQSIFLLPIEVVSFLRNWIDSQTTFTPRQDVDNFPNNIKKVIEDQDLKKEVVEKINYRFHGNYSSAGMSILQKSFEHISIIDDVVGNRQETEQKLQAEKAQKEYIANMKNKEETEKKDELDNLEKMLDNL